MSLVPPRTAAVPLRRTRIKGEPYVWLTATGLVVAFTLAAVLLLVIVGNGLSVFWPHRVVEYTLRSGTATTVVAGSELKRLARSGGEPGAPVEIDIHLNTGNKDVYGNGFRYIRADEVVAERQPEDLVRIEREEYGDAIAYLVELKLRDLQTKQTERIPVEDVRFTPELNRLLAASRARWDEIRALEKGRIGGNSRELAALDVRRRTVADGPERDALDARTKVLKAEYQELSKQAGALRAQQTKDKLAIRLPTGEVKDLAIGKVVGLQWPNRLGFFGRLGAFFDRVWEFLSDSPREANTEGGIFPAIFGTFVMTLMMSVGVVPLGVLAAVYLREYAKQGPLVRGVRIAVNNLAGVPSIVFGVFGLGFFVYVLGAGIDSVFFRDWLPAPTFGTGGILWAAATLALMTVPVVVVATEEAIAAVPRGAKEASLALGASKWQTIQRIVLPASVPGILTGTILAMARGAGEVAPLMLVGVVKLAPTLPINGEWPFVHLDQKFMHLGFHIYDLGFQSPDSEAARPAVFATTLILILLVLILNMTAIILRERLRRKYRTGAF